MEPYCLLFHLDSLCNISGSFLILLSRILIWVKSRYGIQIFRAVVIITLLRAESSESQRLWSTEPARAWWDWAIKLHGTFTSDKQHVTIAPDPKKALTECSLYWTSYQTQRTGEQGWGSQVTRLLPNPLKLQSSWQVTPPVSQVGFIL